MKRNENKKSLTKKIVAGTGLALLLALVGYTGANTYAKYIESTNVASTSATVAKWGYVATANTENLWDKEYNWNGTDASTVDGTGTLTVQASDSTLAPGTTGYFELHINGSAEVLSSIKIVASSTNEVYYDDYYPVKWNVTGNAKIGAVDYMANFTPDMQLSKLVTELNKINNEEIAPNVVADIDLVITWDWDFHVDDATDKLDTILGHLSDNNTIDGKTAPTVDYSVTTDLAVVVTVAQEQN